MKKLILFFITLSPLAWGQQIDYNKVILPKTAQNIDLGERLVQIAWENNPQNKAILEEKEVAKQSLRIARWSWLDNVTGQYNYNQYNKNQLSQDPNVATPTILYPRYNLGVRVSLGDLVRIPLQTKRAKNQYNIADQNVNTRKLELRAQVLEAYQNYLMNKELLKIQTEVTEDANATFSLAEKKFKDGDLTFEEYNEALQKYNGERVRKITSENAFQVSKIRLEEIVGIRMEDIE